MSTGTSAGMTAVQRQRVQVVAALLAVTALVLAIVLVQRLHAQSGWRAEVGEKVPLDSRPYGREATVVLPSAEVQTHLAPPVTSLDHGEVGYDYEKGAFDFDDPDYDPDAPLTAPSGGVLVPVSWSVLDRSGYGGEQSNGLVVSVVLVAGDERVDLDAVELGSGEGSGDDHDVAVAVASPVELDDLSIEVTYDGVTQTVSGEDGSIDAGLAAPLYEQGPTYTADCADVEDGCELTATDPDSPLRPRGAGFTVQGVALHTYDAKLGWAEDGQRWATVYVQLFGVDAVQDAGDGYWFPKEKATLVTLDGADPVRNDLEAAQFGGATGYVQFAVDADDVPKVIRIDQILDLKRAPLSRLDVEATVRIHPDAV